MSTSQPEDEGVFWTTYTLSNGAKVTFPFRLNEDLPQIITRMADELRSLLPENQADS